jgi:NitT/TauT family transport system ATP-binding protein
MSSAAFAATGCVIRLDSVSKTFSLAGEQRPVLKDVSLDISSGQIVSLVGRSGVGKSTFLRLIAGLLSPDAGSVEVSGADAGRARRAKKVAFMPQSPALMPWRTVSANVEVVQRVNHSPSRTYRDVEEVLRGVGLYEFRDAYPWQLSGGMQHRVSLARALALDAPLLALDEPFSSLDELTRDSLYDLLIESWSADRRTVVVVTHNLDEAVLLSDRIVVMGGSPASIIDIVDVAGDRPRRGALDAGAYGDALIRLRSLLQGAQS